ncbi:SHOCT domain-containing protein [Cryobacterium lactosi]|uniref:SHOCT domain-containing protein n=1 Tax=Cryobacterium lactosi TaxID=1259202 RepID=A0A4R9BYP1_9MICO|nr:SHOCT domain-containing protein [Cryobacterium lactosi]TFD94623.1 SHOCT domain-containing protein [Cryobacterium lactosi]
MMWGYGMNPAWLWLYGALSLVAVVILIVWTVRVFRDDASSPVGARRSDARRILDERYARGELTTEQYREQVAELGEKP